MYWLVIFQKKIYIHHGDIQYTKEMYECFKTLIRLCVVSQNVNVSTSYVLAMSLLEQKTDKREVRTFNH